MAKILGVHKFSTLTDMTITTLTSGSGTYTPPANVLYLRVKMVGGGGGGASYTSGVYGGEGGGSGGYVDALIANPSSSYTYAVGVGGSAGAAGTSGSLTIREI